MALEREILGAYVSRHPLEAVGSALLPAGCIRADELGRHAGRRVELVGWIVCTKRVRTSKGEYMRFLTFEDTTAVFEAVLFPSAYTRFGHLLKSRGPFAVRGIAADDGGVIVVRVERLRLLAVTPREVRRV